MSKHPITNETQRAAAIHALCGLDLTKPWTVEIKKKTKQRTLNQNALYWKWIGIFANETGNSEDDMHEFFKDKWCPISEVTVGDEVRQVRSTKKLKTVEMTEYMDKVYAFIVGEFGIILPIPEDQGRIQ